MTTLADLLTRYARDLELVVQRYADAHSERDELRQDIAIAIWRAMPKFRGDASERTYVLRIARNRAVTYCARRARWRALFTDLPPETKSVTPVDAPVLLAEFRAELASAMRQLPDRQRQCLELAADGWTPTQISRALGSSAGAVRVSLHRARLALRALLPRGP